MRRNTVRFIVTLTLGILLVPIASQAQQPGKVARIGYLSLASPPAAPRVFDAFRQGLRELGWVEGRNVVIEERWAEGKFERLPALAAELLKLKADILVTPGDAAARVAKQATSTLPVVMVAVSDPVGIGLVASLARPGANITGLSTLAPELSGKNLELLKEIVPGVTRVAVLWNAAYPRPALREIQEAARALGVQPQLLAVRDPAEFDDAFGAMTREGADALLVLQDPMFLTQHRQLADLAAKHRLPAMYQRREYVEAGGLIAYGSSRPELFRRAAAYVDKILKGAKPADLPVEQPTKFELVINLKTANALGLTIPPSFLFQADEVIK